VNPYATLADLYPDGLAFSGFAPQLSARWVSHDLHVRLALTGGPLPIRGTMPMLCSAGTLAGAAVVADLSADALSVPTDGITSFTDEADYAAALERLTSGGVAIVTQHRHPESLLPAGLSWVPPEIQGVLNDKGSLEELVPERGRPRRRVGDPRDAAWVHALRRASLPMMIKAATRQSTGGGTLDVVPCFTASDLDTALDALADSERLVAEEWIDNRARHLCVNAAVLPDGSVSYVGSAEVISSGSGAYLGNWIGDADASSSTKELVLEIARAGGSMGYRGLLGIDVAELPDGSTLAYDLNFRLCGSTAPLLLAPAVLGASGERVARSRPWLIDMALPRAARRLEQARAVGLIPTAVFDPAAHALSGPIRVSSLVAGSSRHEVEERITEIESILC
jgi:hypothetical protein